MCEVCLMTSLDPTCMSSRPLYLNYLSKGNQGIERWAGGRPGMGYWIPQYAIWFWQAQHKCLFGLGRSGVNEAVHKAVPLFQLFWESAAILKVSYALTQIQSECVWENYVGLKSCKQWRTQAIGTFWVRTIASCFGLKQTGASQCQDSHGGPVRLRGVRSSFLALCWGRQNLSI